MILVVMIDNLLISCDPSGSLPGSPPSSDGSGSGGGGSGGSEPRNGGSGGSGIILIAYPIVE